MKSGKLRYPCEILREVTEQTQSGAETVVYKTVLNTRCGLTTVNGREFIEGGAETMETTLKVVVRATHQRILLGDVVKADKKMMKVLGVLEFDTGRSLQLMCKELL